MAKKKKTEQIAGTVETTGTEKQKPQKNRKARLIVSLVILALVVALVAVLLNINLGQADQIDDAWNTPDYLQKDTINILICGVDHDESRPEDPWLTDVIMVVNFNKKDGTATLLQIPRDTYIGEELVDGGKINALYYYGYRGENDKPGIRRLAETINTQFKLPIDKYIVITMEGFRQAVDILGGIEITLDHKIDMGDGIVFEQGSYTLDGVMADKFVRYRGYNMADLERQNVQRYFMGALMKRMLETSTMDLASLAKAIYPHLETNLDISEILSLAMEARKLSLDKVTVIRVPGEGVAAYGKWGHDVFTIHRKELADYLNDYMRPFGEKVPETELEVIQIQKTTTWNDDTSGTLDEYGEQKPAP